MRDLSTNQIKIFISRAILAGLIAVVIAFAYVLLVPKEYAITGKLVVFPAGSATADKNLGLEVGNTVEILNGSAFQKNTFQGEEKYFAGAKSAENSSVVKIVFFAPLGERTAAEDAIARTPQAVSDYTRDLYGGSPFKYKLLGDPEISSGPAEPSLPRYLGGGFAAGVILFFLYWLFFEFLWISRGIEQAEKELYAPKSIPSVNFHVKSPAPKAAAFQEKEETEKPAETSRPTPAVRRIEPVSRPDDFLLAPENLPISDAEIPSESEAEQETPPLPVSPYQEPTDDEVKDRLNRLMRGEL